jgi:hypothetical protein
MSQDNNEKKLIKEVTGYSYVGLVVNKNKVRIYSGQHCFEGTVLQSLPDVIVLERTDKLESKPTKTVILKSNINGFDLLP